MSSVRRTNGRPLFVSTGTLSHRKFLTLSWKLGLVAFRVSWESVHSAVLSRSLPCTVTTGPTKVTLFGAVITHIVLI